MNDPLVLDIGTLYVGYRLRFCSTIALIVYSFFRSVTHLRFFHTSEKYTYAVFSNILNLSVSAPSVRWVLFFTRMVTLELLPFCLYYFFFHIFYVKKSKYQIRVCHFVQFSNFFVTNEKFWTAYEFGRELEDTW